MTIEGNFGDDFQQLAYWSYNIIVYKNLPIELWLEYEKQGNCEFRIVIRKIWNGSVDEFFEEEVYSEADLEKAIIMDSKDSNYLLIISIEACGNGKLQLGNLHSAGVENSSESLF